jgi:uncharacterized membrane protein
MGDLLYALLIIIIVILLEYISLDTIRKSIKYKNNKYILGIFLYLIVGWLLYKLFVRFDLLSSRFLLSKIFIVIIPLFLVYLLEEKFPLHKKMGFILIVMGIFILEYQYLQKIFYSNR